MKSYRIISQLNYNSSQFLQAKHSCSRINDADDAVQNKKLDFLQIEVLHLASVHIKIEVLVQKNSQYCSERTLATCSPIDRGLSAACSLGAAVAGAPWRARPSPPRPHALDPHGDAHDRPTARE